MKKSAFCLLLAVALVLAAIPASAKDYQSLTVKHELKCGGLVREFWSYIPENLPEGAPLVVCISGYRGGRKGPAQKAGFDNFMALADREGFAVCVPKACGSDQIGYGMNVGYPFQQKDEGMQKVDDVKFLVKMVKYMQKKYALSSENVFCTGASNGGEMCYHMAYLKPGFFKAYGSQYGLTMTWLYKSASLQKAVPLIEIHGTSDRTSQWEGSHKKHGYWGQYISVPLAVNQFALKAKCTFETCEELSPINPESTRRILLHKYLGGDNGVEVWLYEIVGGEHGDFSNEIRIEECIWDFFKKYL